MVVTTLPPDTPRLEAAGEELGDIQPLVTTLWQTHDHELDKAYGYAHRSCTATVVVRRLNCGGYLHHVGSQSALRFSQPITPEGHLGDSHSAASAVSGSRRGLPAIRGAGESQAIVDYMDDRCWCLGLGAGNRSTL